MFRNIPAKSLSTLDAEFLSSLNSSNSSEDYLALFNFSCASNIYSYLISCRMSFLWEKCVVLAFFTSYF